MYFLLILFFASLLGIIFMIGRKLLMLQGEQIVYKEEILKTPFLEEWKYLTIKNTKKQAYVLLVGTIRVYVRSSNFIKNQYRELIDKLQNQNNLNTASENRREISKFLKIISDYKLKIRTIKQKIKEEEKNLE